MSISWWTNLDSIEKSLRAAVFIFALGVGLGLYIIQDDVSANTQILAEHTNRIQVLESQTILQNNKLDRLICYSEEKAKESNGISPNYARCTR